jgi:hypothetical protein
LQRRTSPSEGCVEWCGRRAGWGVESPLVSGDLL